MWIVARKFRVKTDTKVQSGSQIYHLVPFQSCVTLERVVFILKRMRLLNVQAFCEPVRVLIGLPVWVYVEKGELRFW